MSRGLPFEPGNKFGRGRPKGSRNKSTSAAADRLVDEHAEPLMRKNIAEGLQNDTKSRLWCLDHMAKKKRLPKLKLPPIKTLDDIANACDKVMDAVANRKCPAADGQILMSMLETRRKMLETQEFALRFQELEQRVKSL
jgi:hypothetical protein